MGWLDIFLGAPVQRALEPTPEVRNEHNGVDILVPPARPSGLAVTHNSALSLAEVYRAVNILTTAGSQLTLDVFKGNDPVSAPLWVSQPDIKISRSLFLGQIISSLALSGNAFVRVLRDDPTAKINGLIVENPFDVAINTDSFGNVVDYGIAGRDGTFKPWQIQHLVLQPVPGSARGLGPIQACRQDIKGALDVRDYGTEFLDTGDVPSGVLASDNPITNDQAQQYAEAFANRGYGTAVLGAGLHYEPILLSPKDAQFIESREFSSAQIARMFGIPARLMLIDAGSEDYANVQDADTQFVKWTLSAYTRAIEEMFSSLLPRGTVARFNLDAFVRPSTLARYQANEIALRAGWMTVNEIRAQEGLAPKTGGNALKPATTPIPTPAPEATNV